MSTTPTTIARSPADVLRLVVAAVVIAVLLLLEWWFGDTLVAFASDLLRGLDAVPQWILDITVVGTRILAVVVLGGGLGWAIVRRRWRLLATTACGAALALGVFAVLDALIDTGQGSEVAEVGVSAGPLSSDRVFSAGLVAAVAGALTAAAPWMSRRWRQAGWALLLGLTVVTFVETPISFDTALGLTSGWLGGAAVLVAAGAPSRRPTTEAVRDGLRSVGLPIAQLDRAGVDARGSTPYFGVAEDGSKLFVKALGDDERSADLLFRLYRGIQPHDLGDERPFSSLRRSVEHEAFVALTAAALGVRTPALRAFATAEPNGYVLAYDAIAGRSLDRVAPGEVTDDVLAAVWAAVGQLREHRIAHRDLRLANVFLDDGGQVWIIDFGFSEVAASDLLLATDVAELIASSSGHVGPERAVAHAASSVDQATLSRAVDRLRRWGLSGAHAAALAERPGSLDDLRRRLAAAAGAAGQS